MGKNPNDEPAMARARALFEQSGLSLMELGRRMGYSEETARQSAWQFMKSNDPRIGMLRKFAEAMDVSLDDLTPKSKRKRMPRKLETELKECGCSLDVTGFRERIDELRVLMFPNWTADDLVCHPRDACNYCDKVRSAIGCDKLEDFVILKALLNIRKAH
jgi:transcriptional regulator with XRE-family HTH domain